MCSTSSHPAGHEVFATSSLGVVLTGGGYERAEEMGAIVAVGEWVLNEACQRCAAARHRGLGGRPDRQRQPLRGSSRKATCWR